MSPLTSQCPVPRGMTGAPDLTQGSALDHISDCGQYVLEGNVQKEESERFFFLNQP